MLISATAYPQLTILTATSLLLLVGLVSTLPVALPIMTARSNVALASFSNALSEITSRPTGQLFSGLPSSPSSAIFSSSSSVPSQPRSTHVLTSGSSYLPTHLTLSDTFLLLFRRLHSPGFQNGILGCLAVFWAIVGVTIGVLWGLSIYIRHREAKVRQQRARQDDNGTSGEMKLSRSSTDLTLGPRSALSSPERRASYGLVSPKSVRWAEQLTIDEPRDGLSQYREDRSPRLDDSATQEGEEADLGMYLSTSVGNKCRYSGEYKSDRVRRVVAKLKAGGSTQLGFNTVDDVVLVLEGDLA